MTDDEHAFIESLAKATHELRVERSLADGWSYSQTADLAAKRHPCMDSYEFLPEWIKEGERAIVRDIAEILKRAGYTIVRNGVR